VGTKQELLRLNEQIQSISKSIAVREAKRDELLEGLRKLYRVDTTQDAAKLLSELKKKRKKILTKKNEIETKIKKQLLRIERKAGEIE
jgi:hypothetical protein